MENVDPGEKRAIDATLAALKPLGLRIHHVPTAEGLALRLDGGDEAYDLLPVWAGEGYPADVSRAIAARGEHGLRPDSVVLVVAARRLSRGGRQIAEEHGAGWVDLDGNARIVAPPGLLVLREVPATAGTPPLRRWTASALTVAEYLLSRVADGDDAVPGLAEFAIGWSPSQIGKVLTFFDEQGWTAKGSGDRGPTARRRVADPGGLLSAWAREQAGRTTDVHGYSVGSRDLRKYAHGLDALLDRGTWCVTGWLALDVYAPFATGVPMLDVYVDDDALAKTVMTFAGVEWRPVERGARVRLLRAEPHVLAFARREKFAVASPVRVYADLLGIGVRGEDAAAHLRETWLGF